jgi:hypothetical protein
MIHCCQIQDSNSKRLTPDWSKDASVSPRKSKGKQRKAKRGGNLNHAQGAVWLFIGSQRISAKEKRSPYHWESDLRNIKTIENRRV